MDKTGDQQSALSDQLMQAANSGNPPALRTNVLNLPQKTGNQHSALSNRLNQRQEKASGCWLLATGEGND